MKNFVFLVSIVSVVCLVAPKASSQYLEASGSNASGSAYDLGATESQSPSGALELRGQLGVQGPNGTSKVFDFDVHGTPITSQPIVAGSVRYIIIIEVSDKDADKLGLPQGAVIKVAVVTGGDFVRGLARGAGGGLTHLSGARG